VIEGPERASVCLAPSPMDDHLTRPAPPSHRRWVRAVVVLTLAGAAVFAESPAMACGCGGVVSEPGAQTSVAREVALIMRSGLTESITMQLSMDSTAEDLGLLVPTPTPATVALGDPQVFTDLSSVARPRRVEDFHLFGPPVLFDSDDGSSSGAAAPGAGGGVTALSTVDLGPLEATTLRADDPDALQTWLAEHHYQLRPGLEDQLAPYIDEGWTFVAVRLTQEGRALHGVLPPIVMTFVSDEMVYPMRMSRAASGAESVRTYVLDHHRVQRVDPTAATGNPQLVFAGRLSDNDVTSRTMKSLATAGPSFLTVIDQYFAQPSEGIVSDFTFTAAPTDDEVIPTYTVDTYGIPIDIAVLLVLVLAGLTALGWRVIGRRRRDATA